MLLLPLLELSILPLEPIVKGGVDILGEAGPPLEFEKFEDEGERSAAVSGVTLSGDCRSSDPDMPISKPYITQHSVNADPHAAGKSPSGLYEVAG